MASTSGPYPGLRPFRQDEHLLFFGRFDQTTALYRLLDRGRFLAVVGGSGSGKSSLVRAGLLPLLADETNLRGAERWLIVAFRPGVHPVNRLAAALCEAAGTATDPLERVAAGLRRTSGGLANEVGRLVPADHEVLILVDQFEELFRYADAATSDLLLSPDRSAVHVAQEDEARRFVDNLLTASSMAQRHIRVVLTMRSDFIGDCARFPGLAEAVSGNQYLTPRLDRDQLTEAIVGPLLRVSGRLDPDARELSGLAPDEWADLIEPRLVEQLKNDAGDNPDQLPVLQHALLRCWQTADGARLDLDRYRTLGGWGKVLSDHADEVQQRCGPARGQVVERVFRAITELDPEGRAIRRPRTMAQLVTETGVPDPDVRAVVAEFSAPDCSFLVPPMPPDELVDIGHEALIRNWLSLKESWIEAERRDGDRWRSLLELTASGDRIGKALMDWWQVRQPSSAWAARWSGGAAGAEIERVAAHVEWSEADLKRELDEKHAHEQAEQRAREAELRAAHEAQMFAEERASRLRESAEAEAAAAKRLRQWLLAMGGVFGISCIILISLVVALRAVSEQTRETQIQESQLLALLARSEIDHGDAVTGALIARRALPEDVNAPNRPIVPEAQAALLQGLFDQREQLVLQGHNREVKSVAFSPDGSRLASASYDGTVRLWDVASGSQLQVLRGHTAAIQSVAFSPDGSRLASASYDGTVRLWDVASGSQLQVLRGHISGVLSVKFSPNGSQLASASFDGMVRLWDVASGSQLQVLRGHTDTIQSVAFSPNGSQLASASNDRTIRLWDVASNREPMILRGHTDAIQSVAFSPDGTKLASASVDETVRLWDVASGSQLQVLRSHEAEVYSVAFSPDGSRLASASNDRTIRLWDVASNREPMILRGHTAAIGSVAFSPDGSRLASASWDRTIRLWDVASNREPMILRDVAEVYSVAFSPNGSRLASASNDETVRLWDVASGSQLQVLQGHAAAIDSVAFSPDGTKLASASIDGTVRLWDVASCSQLQVLRGHEAEVHSVAFSPDGSRLASASNDGTVRLWDVASGSQLQVLRGHEDEVYSVAFSPDGSRLASASRDWTIRLWDVASGSQLQVLQGHKGIVMQAIFSSNSTKLASASLDRTVRLWDVASGSQLQVLQGHKGNIRSVAFSPDGSRLASASDDKTVRLWDVAFGRQLVVLRGHTRGVLSVAFSPDGTKLASASLDGTVRLWSMLQWLSLASQEVKDLILNAQQLPRQLSFEQEELFNLHHPREQSYFLQRLMQLLPAWSASCQ